MAQIEIPQSVFPNVQQAGIPGVRVSESAPIEAFGGGRSVEAAGQAAEGVADYGSQIIDRAKKEADQVATMRANTALTQAKNDLIYNPQNGLMTMKGQDAFAAPDKVMPEFDKRADAIAQGLSNDHQRYIFQHMLNNHRSDLDGEIQRHVYTESKVYDQQSTDAALQSAREDAILNYHDADKVRDSVTQQQAIMQDFGKRQGWSDDLITAKTQEMASKTHFGVINRMLANDQDQAAKQYFADNKEEMESDDVTHVEKSLEEGTLRGESQRQADSIMGSTKDRGQALLKARQIDDPKLRDEVERRVSNYYSEQKQAQREHVEDLYLQSTNMLDSKPGQNARDVIPPAIWTQLPLSERTALENRSRHDVENDDQKWLDYLSLGPTQIAQLTRTGFETQYWSHFDQPHRNRAEEMWTRAQKGEDDPKLTQALSFNEQLRDSMKASGLIPANKEPGKYTKQEATMYAQYEMAASRNLEDFERNDLGGKRKASQTERQKILDDLVMKKVFVNPGWFSSGQQKPAATVTSDEKGTAYVPIKQIPDKDRNFIENVLKSRGKTVSDDIIQKAYAAYLMGDRKLFDSYTAGQ